MASSPVKSAVRALEVLAFFQAQRQPASLKLIADRLDISVRTVEVHRSRVFEKMEVKSAVELANLLRNMAP